MLDPSTLVPGLHTDRVCRLTVADTAQHAEQGGLPATAVSRPSSGIPTVVWCVTALHVTFLLTYSILLPTYRAPDEQLHVDLAHLFAETAQYPAWDDRDTGSDIERSTALVQFSSRAAHLSAEEALPKDQRPSLEDLEEPPIPTGVNQLPQHPPLYYVLAGGAERAVEVVTGDPDFQLETWFYRLVSILFVVPLPLIIWRVSEMLQLPRAVGVAATIIPLAIPQYLHIASSVNNDSLQLLVFWLVTPLVLRLADGDLRPRTATLAGLLTGIGLLTKAFAFVMAAWVLGGLVLAVLRLGRNSLARAAGAGAIYGAVSFAIGGWWWARNLILYGELMPSRFGEVLAGIPERPRDVGEFLHAWGTATIRRFWGDFGWYDVHLPGYVVTIASATCLVALLVSCLGRDHVANTPRGTRLLLAAPFVLLVVIQFVVAFRSYLDTGRLGGLQGRYWFGSLAALSVMIALGAANLVRRGLRWLPLCVLVAAGVMQVWAARSLLGFYWGEPGSPLTERLRAVVAWAPMPGEMIALGALVGSVVLVATVGMVIYVSLRPGGAPRLPPRSAERLA
jgi:small subunit ribosomal protein S36